MVNGAERQTIATINAPQIPLSPSVQQSPVTQAKPSTVGARSPLQTPGPLYAHGHGSAEATSRRHETTRMRSSIACTRCRRSKTKCDNNGIRDSTGALAACKSCVAGKRLCEYPAPQPANISDSQRRESTVAPAGDEAPPKKRKRPILPPSSIPSRSKGRLGTLEDALESPLFTPKVWEELWAVHEKHYATEFSFLHKRTFLGPLQRLPPVPSSEKVLDPQGQRNHDPALVLAFLTQTAPFHEELVKQTDHNSPYEAAEFYAAATRKHLNYDFSGEGNTAMQQIQAFLMLGYHEWAACHSRNGYMLIRTAVNFAQMNDYQYDEDLEKGEDNKNAASKRDRFIRQESRRQHGRQRSEPVRSDAMAGSTWLGLILFHLDHSVHRGSSLAGVNVTTNDILRKSHVHGTGSAFPFDNTTVLRASCAADPSCWVHEFVREEWWCSKQVIADGPRAKDHKLPTFRLVLPIAPSPDADASPSRRAVRCGAAGLNQSHVTTTRGFQHVHENVVCEVTSPQLPLKDQTPTFTAYWRTNSRPALCLFRRGCPQGQYQHMPAMYC
ncbi:hypothetical protein EJ07DRAFT_159289 [Lizonia empirigonia]|nr:hypothetical protein EJ07DRAFT_159289 [Lizonia empirigonia]